MLMRSHTVWVSTWFPCQSGESVKWVMNEAGNCVGSSTCSPSRFILNHSEVPHLMGPMCVKKSSFMYCTVSHSWRYSLQLEIHQLRNHPLSIPIYADIHTSIASGSDTHYVQTHIHPYAPSKHIKHASFFASFSHIPWPWNQVWTLKKTFQVVRTGPSLP